MSVSGVDLFGPLTAGTVRRYDQTDTAEGVDVTRVVRVVGPRSFDGNAAVEQDAVTTTNVSAVSVTLLDKTETTRSYLAQTADGVVSYGTTGTTAVRHAGSTSTKDTYDPATVVLPAALDAGVPYRSTVTDTSRAPGSSRRLDDRDRTVTVTLASEQTQTVTVPAGTFQAYVLTQRLDIDGHLDDDRVRMWSVPGVGPVKVVTSTDDDDFTDAGDVVSTFEMTSFRPGTAAGTAALTATTDAGTVPSAAAVGARLRGTARVTIANAGPGLLTGTSTVALFASTTGGVDAASVRVGVARRRATLAAGQSATVAVPVGRVALPAGTYALLAQVTAADGTVTTATVGPTVAVAPAAVSLSAAVAVTSTAIAGRALPVTLSLTNAGNVSATGRATVTVALSLDGGGDTVPVATVHPRLSVRPGTAATPVRLAVRLPADVAGSRYFVRVTVLVAGTSAVAVTADPIDIHPAGGI